MQSLTTKPFVDGYVFLEGPRWHDNKLWVSDIWAHKVYGLRADGRAEVAAEVAGRPPADAILDITADELPAGTAATTNATMT